MTWRAEWEEPPHRRMGFGGGGAGGRFFAVAPITRVLVLLCIAVTLLSALGANWFAANQTPTRWLALSLDNAKYVYPFFTYVLPHSTYDAWHIVANMVMLWYLGQELEVRLGRARYLTLFFGAAVFGALAHLFLGMFMQEGPAGLMGASGGIFALIFFIARESPSRPFFFFFIAVPARVLAMILVVINAWPIFFSDLPTGVAHACHLAGAAFGWVFQRHPFDAFAAVAGIREAARDRAAAREQRRASDDDAEMDRLLEKIHDHGITSLSDRERRFLDERSRNLRGGRR